MPRNKHLMKKRAVGGSSGGRGPKKIVIRPFQKPPTLPTNYYEQTSRELLEGTVAVAFGQTLSSNSSSNNNSSNSNSNNSNNLSLQNSYQQVVNLVSHKFGPKLYRDLVATLQKACEEHALPGAALEPGASDRPGDLLGYIQGQYQKYVDYLLLCKHVFLPLDRTHAWSPSTGEVAKRSSPGADTAGVAITGHHPGTSGNNGTAPDAGRKANLMDLWQVGLLQFRRRLKEFRWDELIYQKWWESLQMDWDKTLAGRGLDQQELLQTTLYMWQDLGILGETLSKKLEPDLIRFFQQKSRQLKSNSSGGTAAAIATTTTTFIGADSDYNAEAVVSYCYSKWMHVAHDWSRFLPKKTCVKLLEDHLFSPHLTAEWLLHPRNFDPILEKAFAEDLSSLSPPPPQGGAPSAALPPMAAPSSAVQELWMLAGRLPDGYGLVASAISQYARTRGGALMGSVSPQSGAGARAGKQKITDLLELQGRLQGLLAHLPHSGEHCALKNVWEDVINPSSDGHQHDDETSVVAEALAKYVDACLKDGKRQMLASASASALSSSSPAGRGDNWAEAVISGVFCYLQAKDTFEAFYKQDLAKRLLWNRVVSMDVERHFVSLLKAECGAGYTSKMEGMFQDMDWSRETMNRYKQAQYQHEKNQAFASASAPGGGESKVEMDMQVLTTGFWPVYPQYPKLILPKCLLDPQNKFTEYYKTKYQGRRMTWQYALGHVVVRFKPRGENAGPKYELLVSLCQALVLLQFNNDGTELRLPQLMAAVGLEDRKEMERILLSLSLGKEGTRVLHKRDHDRDAPDVSSSDNANPGKKKKTRMNVHDLDTFRVQSGFKSNTRRIRINNILMKETKEERDKTVKAVSRDRLYLVDAVLVRIMKARKTILHQELIPQVLEQVKVPAQPSDIKKRIETLIEREYFERDANDRNRYNYLA
ncbi:unnamed protein product [Pseudo-nitzschia multistriata]|uniref:Cullin family profile domain-containing protein n=1 Tax=Pseudo-nitzschia multistriata TaxID=183589 RepID=A0A448YU96_9STRA|nr:unnamed protein product [Pseudo-nitzschia multistriata]